MLYGELVRVSAVGFLIRPALHASVPSRAIVADDVLRITPLAHPR